MESVHIQSKSMDTKVVFPTYAITQSENKRRCYLCDSDKHLANVCRHKDTICNQCSLKGHLARTCRRPKQRNNVNACVSERRSANDIAKSADNEYVNENLSDIGEEGVYYVTNSVKKAIICEIEINDSRIEIDTGSGLSIISEKTYRDYFIDVNLIRRTYSNGPLSVLGKINPIVEYGGN